MSIILIDDVLFNDNEEERRIRYNNCIFFLVLNGLSIFSGVFYLYFYFRIPYYQNSSNSLSLFLNIFLLISNCFYFLIFFELYLYEPTILSLTIKIITIFNPLVILCIYYWTACLTHNLYVTYYNCAHNMDNMYKRIKYYKYLLFIIIIIFFLYTLFNIDYNDSQLLSKSFSFISNYNKSFLEFFYINGFFVIIYISIKLYYVINKKEDFVSVHEYQENEERNQKIKNIFKSVISRNISFVCYFLITFTPANIIMLFKYCFGKSNIKKYYIDFIVIMLISFYGSFLFIVGLFDQLMRNFIISLLLFNREFLSEYEEQLLNEKRFKETLIETDNENFSEVKTKIIDFPNNYNENNDNFRKFFPLPLTKAKSEGKKVKSVLNKVPKLYKINELDERPNNDKNFEMDIINDNNKTTEKGNLHNPNNENIDNKKEDNCNSNITLKDKNNIDTNSIKPFEIEIKDENKDKNVINDNIINIKKINVEENDKSNNNYFYRFDSYFSGDNNNSSKNILRLRSKSTSHPQSYDQNEINRTNKFSEKYNSNIFTKSFRKNKNNFYEIKIPNLSASSSTSHCFKSKFLPPGTPKKRSNSRAIDTLYHEEISSFALMTCNLEINENLLRMIAISISLNECRVYDENSEYKKYYESTVPWENKEFYKEATLVKEYDDDNLPDWLGIKNDKRFININFKIMSYCPFVFHHIRLIDKISIDDLLLSLAPINNAKKIKEMKVSGGRGNNSLVSTWDKKIIVKTINETEKKILIDKMIVKYHYLMQEKKSILSRIYGIFKIELKDKGSINVILQKNMNDLPSETKLLTFDFKGSTVDRQTIDKKDVGLNMQKLINKYNNKVLKDIDLGIVGMKFSLNYKERQKIISIIYNDSSFLQNLEVTDYSLVVFVHKYRKKDIINIKRCPRIIESKNKKFIFNFAIVDFLGTFNLEKKGEKLAKSLVGYIKKLKDTNFSVLEPNGYGMRFRNFCKEIIING